MKNTVFWKFSLGKKSGYLVLGKGIFLCKIDCMKSKASGSHALSLEYSEGSSVTHSIYHCAIGKAALLELSITG